MNSETDSHTPAIVKTEHLSKTFHVRKGIFGKHLAIEAVRDASLSVPKGKTLGLIGESGSGKSTLARCILRLTDVTHGKIYFEGSEVSAISQSEFRPRRRNMQIVFQDSGNTFNPRIQIGQMLNEIVSIHHIPGQAENRRLISSLLEWVGLPAGCAERYPHELSGGQRQRLGIARALTVNPSFLVCDEPVSSLDISVQAQILNLFRDLQEQNGLTYLFISHELPVIRFMADDIAVMYRGYIVERSGKTEWFTNPLHPYSRAFMDFSGKRHSHGTAETMIRRDHNAGDMSLQSGCVYRDRCPLTFKKCFSGMPEEREIAPGHFIRCHAVS